ncbi:hypothetical protein BA195_10085 [Tenacibaculum soleae]|uniref:RNA polymerase sigma-70 region 2 domain-containing protein n=1 Tax=Tenacibaculum soleae TaxID=447689 RepID=A0A1B9XY85_9FLAO|nr:sigma-70 family RNA polymerase sigma factor [Tenacibaculum soleae]OCK42515.1 hypothetical protein BA195_10085 [Tenacibaculum soleae]
MQPLQKYVEQNKIKLTQDQIKELCNNKERNQDLIIKSQLPLVLNISNSFNSTTGANIEDLFSKALEATHNALINYDNKSNASFTTYAKISIINALKDYRLHNNNIIKQPSKNKELSNTKAYCFSSFNSEDNKAIEDTIEDTTNSIYSDEDKLEQLIKDNLKADYANIVILYFGINQDKSKVCIEIAEELNTTKQNINDKLLKALNKLKSNTHFKTLLKKLYNI